MNKIILINQRLDKFGKHKEVRDNLDPRLVELILKINMRPLIIPNNIQYLKKIFLSNKYNIRGIPTLLLFKDSKLLDTKVGSLPKAALEAWLDTYL